MKNKNYIICLLLIIFLSGCENLKKGLGITKDNPNEFLIEKRDPLVLPPDYKILPPDSNIVNKEKQENSLKSILDKSLTKQQKQPNSNNESSSSLENEILKQIK